MTDKDRVELALRRVADRAASNPFGYWFRELADELAKTSRDEQEPLASAQGATK
jgi:hypothetical protein